MTTIPGFHEWKREAIVPWRLLCRNPRENQNVPDGFRAYIEWTWEIWGQAEKFEQDEWAALEATWRRNESRADKERRLYRAALRCLGKDPYFE